MLYFARIQIDNVAVSRVPKCQVLPIVKCDEDAAQAGEAEPEEHSEDPTQDLEDMEMVMRNPTTPSTAAPTRGSEWFVTTTTPVALQSDASSNPDTKDAAPTQSWTASPDSSLVPRSSFWAPGSNPTIQTTTPGSKPNTAKPSSGTEKTAWASKPNMPTTTIPSSAYGSSTQSSGAKPNTPVSDKPSMLLDQTAWASRPNGPTTTMPNTGAKPYTPISDKPRPLSDQNAWASRPNGPSTTMPSSAYESNTLTSGAKPIASVTDKPTPALNQNAWGSRSSTPTTFLPSPESGSNPLAFGAKPYAPVATEKPSKTKEQTAWVLRSNVPTTTMPSQVYATNTPAAGSKPYAPAADKPSTKLDQNAWAPRPNIPTTMLPSPAYGSTTQAAGAKTTDPSSNSGSGPYDQNNLDSPASGGKVPSSSLKDLLRYITYWGPVLRFIKLHFILYSGDLNSKLVWC